MRILQISDSLKQRFGVTSFLLNYNENINLNKVVFDYLIIDLEKEIERKIKNLDGNIYFMSKLSLRNINSFIKEINSFFELHQYDIVHSHFYQIDFICSKIAKKNGVKHYISHSHNTKYSDYKFRAVRNYIMAFPIKYLSTEFCACSENAGEMLFGSKALNNKKITIIPNAINYDNFYFNEKIREKLRQQYNLNNKIVFGNIGSLKPQKNQLFLLKVIAEIKKFRNDIVLCLVGDGNLRKVLEREAQKLDIIDNVIFTGVTNTPWDYYNMLDCYLFPSVYEGFGLSLLEAEVNGLFCICSDRIPNEPIISKNVIKLPIDNNEKEWAKTCLKTIGFCRNNDEISEFYDIKLQARKLESFYEALIK